MNSREEATSEQPVGGNTDEASRANPAWINWAVLAGVLLLLVLVFKVGRPLLSRWSFDDPTDHPAVGRILHRVELAGLVDSEGEVTVDELRDRVTLIHFWATWCAPCEEEIPQIARLDEEFRGDDAFRLLSVSYGPARTSEEVDRLRAETSDFLSERGLTLAAYCDPAGVTLKTYGELMTMGGGVDDPVLPTTLLLDRDGVVRAVWVGYVSGAGIEKQMHERIAELLESPPVEDTSGSPAQEAQ